MNIYIFIKWLQLRVQLFPFKILQCHYESTFSVYFMYLFLI